MIVVATLLIMLAGAYAQYRNGLFTSVAMLIMVFISGLVAFGFWEPIADFLDRVFQNNALAGCEDMIALTLLFSVTLFALRMATNYIAPDLIDEHGALQHLGGAAVGLVTGYFVAGFLICAMQTLPLDERFMDFQPRGYDDASGNLKAEPNEPPYRSIFPGDRVWLALMWRAGIAPLSWKEDPEMAGAPAEERYLTFDRKATFELRYLRYRRSTETRGPLPYFGEFDRELGKQKPR
jgi:uncharacterized membrane protein required for colicin V production